MTRERRRPASASHPATASRPAASSRPAAGSDDDRRLGARVVRVARRVARRRRAPELARQEILDAAERVFTRAHPERVGLKEVGREAGVSHALVTHYFGTYAGLIEATLDRRIRALRARMTARMGEAGALARPGELLGMLFDALEDPVHLRMMKWMVANERESAAQTLALQEKGVSQIARQVAEALVATPSPAMIATIERALVTAVAAAFGWAMSKGPLAASIGREPTRLLQDEVRGTLAGMVQLYLRAAIGPLVPGGLPGVGDAWDRETDE
ncbi:MAG TPA: TetR/AcrR family transcriptional regulator [Kofleriaceae bacterium]|nr:TetR/AcrR family transcriptional regulator [Kofleriaceae bacterium]